MALPPIVATLLDPGFYPHAPADVELRQTHISYVFLAGDQVFKLKKPVRFPFLDFTTLERRRHFCSEEVRLNRRLAPAVYLGVLALRRDGDSYRWTDEGDARAVEYLVHMRRLPDDRTLDRCLRGGGVDVATIDRVAALLVGFHRGAEVSDVITANGSIAAIARVLRQNYEGSAPFHGVTISAADDEAIQRFARGFLVRNEALFRRRQAERRIRDGHADLHADHVYLTEPPVIVDCVEFSPTFRWCDVASDLSFLTMDLEYHDRPELAARLVERYAALSGDAELARLIPFYACYRAYVRGKVDSLTSAAEEVDDAERARARESARRHFALAYRYTWAYSPALVVVAGRSGTGTSSVARALAARTGFGVIASDDGRTETAAQLPGERRLSRDSGAGLPPRPAAHGEASRFGRQAVHAGQEPRATGAEVPKDPAGLAATERAGDRQRDEIHSAAMSERAHAELFARARRRLAADAGIILDATFPLREGREEARRVAAAAGVPFLLVECRADDALIRRRLVQRAGGNEKPSDAEWAVYLERKQRAEPVLPREQAMVLDTGRALGELVGEIESELRKRSHR